MPEGKPAPCWYPRAKLDPLVIRHFLSHVADYSRRAFCRYSSPCIPSTTPSAYPSFRVLPILQKYPRPDNIAFFFLSGATSYFYTSVLLISGGRRKGGRGEARSQEIEREQLLSENKSLSERKQLPSANISRYVSTLFAPVLVRGRAIKYFRGTGAAPVEIYDSNLFIDPKEEPTSTPVRATHGN